MTKWSTNESYYCKNYNWSTTGRNAASILLPLLGSRGLILHWSKNSMLFSQDLPLILNPLIIELCLLNYVIYFLGQQC